MAISFFTEKYEILQLHPNDHVLIYSEMQNFEKLFTTKFEDSQDISVRCLLDALKMLASK